jgi:hypothetical protein
MGFCAVGVADFSGDLGRGFCGVLLVSWLCGAVGCWLFLAGRWLWLGGVDEDLGGVLDQAREVAFIPALAHGTERF